MTMFWIFLIRLAVGGFVCVLLFSLLITALHLPVLLAGRFGRGEKVAMYLLFITALPTQIFYWGLWSAYCSLLTLEYIAAPLNSLHWLYYLAGFGSCVAPLAYFTSAEAQTKQSSEEARGLVNGSLVYSSIAVIAFVVFCIWPQWSFPPYSWFLRHVI